MSGQSFFVATEREVSDDRNLLSDANIYSEAALDAAIESGELNNDCYIYKVEVVGRYKVVVGKQRIEADD